MVWLQASASNVNDDIENNVKNASKYRVRNIMTRHKCAEGVSVSCCELGWLPVLPVLAVLPCNRARVSLDI